MQARGLPRLHDLHTSCSHNIGSGLQLLAISTDVFVLTPTLAFMSECNKGSLLRVSSLVDLQSIILREFGIPAKERVVATAQYGTLAS